MSICGIIWGYDGTIINSAKKNIEVTIELLKHFDKDIQKYLLYQLNLMKNFKIL